MRFLKLSPREFPGTHFFITSCVQVLVLSHRAISHGSLILFFLRSWSFMAIGILFNWASRWMHGLVDCILYVSMSLTILGWKKLCPNLFGRVCLFLFGLVLATLSCLNTCLHPIVFHRHLNSSTALVEWVNEANIHGRECHTMLLDHSFLVLLLGANGRLAVISLVLRRWAQFNWLYCSPFLICQLRIYL